MKKLIFTCFFCFSWMQGMQKLLPEPDMDTRALTLYGGFGIGFVGGFMCGDKRRVDMYGALPLSVSTLGLHEFKKLTEKAGVYFRNEPTYLGVWLSTGAGAALGLGSRTVYDATLHFSWYGSRKTYTWCHAWIAALFGLKKKQEEENVERELSREEQELLGGINED